MTQVSAQLTVPNVPHIDDSICASIGACPQYPEEAVCTPWVPMYPVGACIQQFAATGNGDCPQYRPQYSMSSEGDCPQCPVPKSSEGDCPRCPRCPPKRRRLSPLSVHRCLSPMSVHRCLSPMSCPQCLPIGACPQCLSPMSRFTGSPTTKAGTPKWVPAFVVGLDSLPRRRLLPRRAGCWRPLPPSPRYHRVLT